MGQPLHPLPQLERPAFLFRTIERTMSATTAASTINTAKVPIFISSASFPGSRGRARALPQKISGFRSSKDGVYYLIFTSAVSLVASVYFLKKIM